MEEEIGGDEADAVVLAVLEVEIAIDAAEQCALL